MIKRIAVIAGVLLLFGATAVVAVAIWPERAGETGSTSTSVSRSITSPDAGGTGADTSGGRR